MCLPHNHIETYQSEKTRCNLSYTERSLDMFGFLNGFKHPKMLHFTRAQTRQVTLHINAQERVTNLKMLTRVL
jgi:hypothetical protein